MTDFRRRILLQGLEPARCTGLEIGPLASPIVRRDDGPVLYVDHADADTLRRKYAGGSVDVDGIVEVDAIWADRSLRETIGGTVDYVIASHVAEHVPDLISWLEEVRGVLNPGGELRLVLPDMRYSFDYFRQPTRLSDLVAAWMVRARRPQITQILDFVLNYAPGIDGAGIDEGRVDPTGTPRHYSFAGAVELAQRSLDNPAHYEDVHCWVFDPAHFAALMLQLTDAGLLQMACAGFVDTEPAHWYEFYMFLRPCDDREEQRESWLRMQAAASPRRAPLPPGWAEQRIAALENSLSWRVTAPLRAMSRVFGRLRRGPG
jgi:hypothetical protein